VNLIRIFDTILLYPQCPAKRPLLPLEFSYRHNASAKIQKDFETQTICVKFLHLFPTNPENTLV
ncbi:MAG: hypothetical protein K5764_05975, partial [Prevotella sp.]|nr:hypothetical protein [Prevotella sp.]